MTAIPPLHWSALPAFEWLETPVWVLDPQTVGICWANAAAVRFWRAESLEELLRRDFSAISPAARTRLDALADMVATGQIGHDSMIFYPLGEPLHALVTRAPIVDEEGRQLILCEARTPSHEADSATLRGVEAIRHTSAMISVFSADGQVLTQNIAADKAYGAIGVCEPEFFRRLVDPVIGRALFSQALKLGSARMPNVPVRSRLHICSHLLELARGTDPVTGRRCVIAYEEDVTSRLEIDVQLRMSLFTLDHAPGVVLWLEPSGRVRYINQYGMALAQRLEKQGAEYIWQIAEIDPSRWRAFWRYLRHCGDSHSELKMTDGQQQVLYLDLNTVLLTFDGQELAICFARDISSRKAMELALKASESRLAEAQHQARLGFWEWDIESGRILWSDETSLIFGFPPELGAPNYATIVNSIHPADREAFRAANTQAVEKREAFDLVLRVVRPDQIIRSVRGLGAPQTDESGRVVKLFGTLQDITEQREADRLKSEFVATVSHELRTPLTSIRGSLGLLLGPLGAALPGPARELVEVADRNTQRLLVLINDLLDIDKIASGKMMFDTGACQLAKLVAQSVVAMQPYAERFNVYFALDGDADGWVWVDSNRVEQVLANLLSNAAKFSVPDPDDPASRLVRVSIHQQEPGWLRVTVQDRGKGIPAAQQERLFQKFSQLDSSDRRRSGGTGLGLWISKALIERMGGRMGFESAEGQGSVFYFDLPECPAPEAMRNGQAS